MASSAIFLLSNSDSYEENVRGGLSCSGECPDIPPRTGVALRSARKQANGSPITMSPGAYIGMSITLCRDITIPARDRPVDAYHLCIATPVTAAATEAVTCRQPSIRIQ